ncbi:MAG TPA: DUF5666 domain-containing protein [Terracidiphilus sp.]
MPARLLAVLLLVFAMGMAYAQDAPEPGQGQAPGQGQGRGGWQQGRRQGGMMGMSSGRGTVGTVTEVAADHFTIKTELGEVYTVHYSVNTRMMKQPAGPPRRRDDDAGQRTPPEAIKATDVKLGDVIMAGGEEDANAKSVGAVFVMLMDPERVKEMRAMEANYGKTWLAGRVTAINEVKVTLQAGPDNTAHSFIADENTTFRKRREPITLGDIQVGDLVRAEGGMKDGAFVATAVAVMTPQPTGGPNHGARVEGQAAPQ